MNLKSKLRQVAVKKRRQLGALQKVTALSTNERDLIVGGQAVIEGVMMRTPNAYAIAVRKADGSIVNISARLPKWCDKYPCLSCRFCAAVRYWCSRWVSA